MQQERTLNQLAIGERATVTRLRTHGSMRRRLLDIGLTEGARIECVGRSPTGDPSAYLIRGAVIAIRCEDSNEIMIEQEESHGTYQKLHGNCGG